MNEIEKYCRSIKKKTERLLKKMFGFPNLKYAIEMKKYLSERLENMSGKKIDEIKIEDVKGWSFGCYELAKYKTLKRIIDLYLDSTSLQFNKDEMEEYK